VVRVTDTFVLFKFSFHNQMKNKKYHTVETITKSNQVSSDVKGCNLIEETRPYTNHFFK
jgi:hypothetical protein